MYKKSPAEMERSKIAKATRTLLRLKYSLMADEAINDILPDRLMDFDNALQQGKLLELTNALEDIADGS